MLDSYIELINLKNVTYIYKTIQKAFSTLSAKKLKIFRYIFY